MNNRHLLHIQDTPENILAAILEHTDNTLKQLPPEQIRKTLTLLIGWITFAQGNGETNIPIKKLTEMLKDIAGIRITVSSKEIPQDNQY